MAKTKKRASARKAGSKRVQQHSKSSRTKAAKRAVSKKAKSKVKGKAAKAVKARSRKKSAPKAAAREALRQAVEMPVETPAVTVIEERMVVVAEQEPVAPATHNAAPGESEGFGPERKSEAA